MAGLTLIVIAGIQTFIMEFLHHCVLQEGHPHPGAVCALGLTEEELAVSGNIELIVISEHRTVQQRAQQSQCQGTSTSWQSSVSSGFLFQTKY